MQRRVGALALAGLLGVGASAARAQESAEELVHERADLTPRAALRAFVGAVRAGDRPAALGMLQLPAALPPEQAWATARQMEAVIDSRIPDDYPEVSDAPEGRGDDRLPPGVDDVARLPAVEGHGLEPMRMVREADGRWRFSATTSSRATRWYAALPDRWLRDRLPAVFFLPGVKGLFWWQLLALPLLVGAAWLSGRLVESLVARLLLRLAARTETQFDDLLLERMRGPLSLMAACGAALLLLPLMLPTPVGEAFLVSIDFGVFLLALYVALSRSIDLGAEYLRSLPQMTAKPQLLALVPLGVRSAKVVLFVVAAVVVLQRLGYPAASLIAGLGIGGLAFALAAQKTVENLFGSVMLSVDQPFRPGDAIKVDDLVGQVEQVGLRSTRVRTLDRTVVTIPNGRLADMRIESYAARDQLRFQAVLGLDYATGAEQLRAIVAELHDLLKAHPLRAPESEPRVLLQGLGQSSFDVEVLVYFQVMEMTAFLQLRHELLLQAIAIVERHGSSLAYPTRTVRVVAPGGDDDGPTPPNPAVVAAAAS